MSTIDSQILSDRARAENASRIARSGEGINPEYVSLVVDQDPIDYVEGTGVPYGQKPISGDLIQQLFWDTEDPEAGWQDLGVPLPTKDYVDDKTSLSGTYVNVKDFGAKGDGVTDDYASIISAIERIPDTGGTIFMPSGDYKIDSSIVINGKSNIKFISQSASIIPDTSVNDLFDFIECSDIVVQGFEFKNNENVKGANIVRGMSVERLTFSHNTIRNCDFGVLARTVGSGCNNFYVHNNILIDAFEHDIADKQNINCLVYGLGPTKRWIVRDNIQQGGRHLVLTDTGDEWFVESNYVINTNDSSIYLRGKNHTIKGNRVLNAGKDGIKILLNLEGDFEGGNIISGNYVKYVGLVKIDGGVHIKSEQKNTLIQGNLVLMDDPENLLSTGLSGIQNSGEGSSIIGNTVIGKTRSGSGIRIFDAITNENMIIANNSIKNVRSGISLEQIGLGTIKKISVNDNNIDNITYGIFLRSESAESFDGVIICNNRIDTFTGEAISDSGGDGYKNIHIEDNLFYNANESIIRMSGVFDDTCLVQNNRSDGSESASYFISPSGRIINNYTGDKKVDDRYEGVSSVVTLNDDEAFTFSPKNDTGILMLSIKGTVWGGLISYEMEPSNANTQTLTVNNINFVGGNVDLDGTTGPDGEVSYARNYPNISIENRTGAQRKIKYTIINSLN